MLVTSGCTRRTSKSFTPPLSSNQRNTLCTVRRLSSSRRFLGSSCATSGDGGPWVASGEGIDRAVILLRDKRRDFLSIYILDESGHVIALVRTQRCAGFTGRLSGHCQYRFTLFRPAGVLDLHIYDQVIPVSHQLMAYVAQRRPVAIVFLIQPRV